MTRKLGLLLVIILFGSPSIGLAGDTRYRTIKIGKGIAPLVFQKISTVPFQVELSPGCSTSKTCEAHRGFMKLKTTNIHDLRISTRGGKNPGAGLCKSALKGKVVIGILPDGSHDSLCRFRDGSLAANSSIFSVYDYFHRPSK